MLSGRRFRLYVLALLIGAAMFLSCSSSVAQVAKPVGETKLVLDFEDAKIWQSENDSPFETTMKNVTQGRRSLKVHYTNKPQWSNILTRQVLVTDWTGFKYLNFDLYLDGKMPGTFAMWVRDKALHKATVSQVPIGPGWNTITVDLDQLQKESDLDRANIISMCLYKETKHEITVYLDNMYLSKEKPVAPRLPPVEMPAKELLTNGSFEKLKRPDALGSVFAWWQARRWQGPSFLGKGEKAVHTGRSSAMIDGRGVCKIGFVTPPVEVKSPTRLRLTAYVQAADLSKGLYRQAAAITVTDVGERPLKDASVSIPEGIYPWKKVELVFDVPAKCPYVKIFIQGFGPGRLWVDDVSLTGVPLDTTKGLKLTQTGRALAVDPPIVTETPAVLAKRRKALAAMDDLRKTVEQAGAKRLETLYAEIPLKLGDLAFNVRWDIPEHLELREGYCDYIIGRCETETANLKKVMAGEAPDLKVPPHPDFARLKLQGRYFCLDGKPKILFSMQYHRRGELLKWFCPEGYDAHISAVGASRYTYQRTPIWPVYQKYPDTRRVYDDSWCGHIVKDQHSLGGVGRCVISLDSPRMMDAIAESIATFYVPAVKRRKTPPLFIKMGWEYSYVNYDKYSGEKFRKWLKRKYGSIDKLNAAWKTKLAGLEDVTMPSYHWKQPEKNPAKYYDWGAFNLWRFTDYLKWSKGQMRKHLPGALTCTGGGEPFGANFWRQGIDEEELANEGVCDIWLSETGSRALGVTSVMDLQRSLKKMLILDPEYHALPNTCFLMFLHGCGVMDYWWWPPDMSGFYESSMKHSHLRTLPEVDAVMITALDVRRIPEYITPFSDEIGSIALLYPRASLIQKFPGAEGHKTPYTLEVEKTYAAAVRLDTPVGFASSKLIGEGVLDRFKILVVPGARYVQAGTYDNIMAWVKGGGTVVITPTSLIADEFNRKRNYLADLGIRILEEELPEFMAGEAKRGVDQSGELDFIQGPVAKTLIKKEPKRDVTVKTVDVLAKAPKKMAAAGVIQTVKPSNDWNVLATYAGEKTPAILVRDLGKGKVYYLAAQLDVESRKALFDALMDALKFKRWIRVRKRDGGYPEDVESRTLLHEGKLLTYLHNLSGRPQTVKLVPQIMGLGPIVCLNTETKLDSQTITLGPYETKILSITPTQR